MQYVYPYVFDIRKKLNAKYRDGNLVSFSLFLLFLIFYYYSLLLIIKISLQYYEMLVFEVFKNSINGFQNSISIRGKRLIKILFSLYYSILDLRKIDSTISASLRKNLNKYLTHFLCYLISKYFLLYIF